jgi:hypothetical protein
VIFFQDKYDPPNFLHELALVEWTEIELRNSSEKKLQQLKLNYPITNIRLLMKECPEEIDELKTADVDKEPEILEIRQKFKAEDDENAEIGVRLHAQHMSQS